MNNLFAEGRKKVSCGFESDSYNAVSEEDIDIRDGLAIGGVEEFVGWERVSECFSNLNAMDLTSVHPVAVVPLIFYKLEKHPKI